MDEKTSNPSSPEATPAGSTIHITNRSDRTLVTHLFQRLIRPFGPYLVTSNERFPSGSPKLSAPSKIEKKWTVKERQVEEVYVYDLESKPVEKKYRHRIFYFAGGGWQSPPSPHHWKFLSELAGRLPDTTVSVVSYPLAPESPLPIAFPQLLKWYAAVMKESEENQELVTFAGDSAGGNVVLGLICSALEQDAPFPAPHSILAICPSVDLTRDNPEIEAIQHKDPFLRAKTVNETARAWLGHEKSDIEPLEPQDSRASPINADLSVLRKSNVIVDGTVAGYDILGPDGRIFLSKLETEHVQGEWLVWEKMMHCWPISATYHIFSESTEAFDWIVDVLRRRSNPV